MRVRAAILLLMISFPISLVFSQKIYYGYPSPGGIAKRGDIIILNVPRNLHGRFEEDAELEQLVNFLNSDSAAIFKISINFILESAEYDKAFSEKLANSLRHILERRCTKSKYEVVGMGQDNLIFLDKNSPRFSKMNTRVEIQIE